MDDTRPGDGNQHAETEKVESEIIMIPVEDTRAPHDFGMKGENGGL